MATPVNPPQIESGQIAPSPAGRGQGLLFTVIIPTRNRPALFRQALQSVCTQSCRDIEIIVVNDGSAATERSAYEDILRTRGDPRIRLINLIERPKGHGQSYANNVGVEAASAPYVCFLDDDDFWTDQDHLGRVARLINEAKVAPDLVMSDQAAFARGERRPGPIWIEDLAEILRSRGQQPNPHGAYTVAVERLLESHGFCHLNTLIVRRALYQEIGGMDETIRWECDRDLYLRLIDCASAMYYFPMTIAQHNIPDPAGTGNMTTAISDFERRLFQVRVLDRAALFARHAGIRAHARQHKMYAVKRIAEGLAGAGRWRDAAWWASQGLGAGPGLKWAGYTAWLSLRSLQAR